MADWFRSLTALGAAFIGVAVVTFGLAGIIVPGQAPTAQPDDGGTTGSPAASAAPLEGIGGDLAVTGDRVGTLSLRSESQGEVYALVGDDARMVVAGQPAEISQISWDGLEFFPDPGDCTIMPGELDDRIGVGYADVRCEGVEDIRGGGTVSMAGRLGLPLNMVGEADLPDIGGSVEVGAETWSFEEAFLFEFPVNSGPGTEGFNLMLTDEEAGGVLRFDYDPLTHALGLVQVQRGGEAVAASGVACALTTRELGRISPSAAIVELTIDCPAADVPGIGTAPIRGTVIVQQLGFTG